MPITMMTNPHEADLPNVHRMDDYPGSNGPLYMKTTHVGLVVGKREMNGHDDSDFYAIVWDADKECTEEVMYATTRGWSYPNGATVDATPEVLEAYRVWRDRKDAEARKLAAEREAATVRMGRSVRVARGRKVPIGTIGDVFWMGQNQWGLRCGIRDADGKTHWTAAKNLDVRLK